MGDELAPTPASSDPALHAPLDAPLWAKSDVYPPAPRAFHRQAQRGELSSLDPRVFSFEKRLLSCAKEHAWAKALRLLGDIYSSCIEPSDLCGSVVLSALVRARKWQCALRIFEGLPAPGKSTYNAAVSACARGALWQLAIALLPVDSLPQDRADGGRDAAGYGAAVDACSRAACWEEALAILYSIEACRLSSSPPSLRQPGTADVLGTLRPTRAGFGAAVSAMMRAAKWEWALALLAWSSARRMQPSVIAYNSAISACGAANEWVCALALLWSMPSQTMQPSVISYNAAADACGVAGQWQMASWVLTHMLESTGLLPTTVSYTTLLVSYARVRRWEAALSSLSSMRLASASADAVAYNAAISACAPDLLWPIALALLQDMRNQKVAATPTTFNAALASLRDSDRWDLPLILLKDIRDTLRHAPDVVAYRAAMEAVGSSLEMLPALLIWREGCDDGVWTAKSARQEHVLDFHDLTAEAARAALAEAIQSWALELPRRKIRRTMPGAVVALNSSRGIGSNPRAPEPSGLASGLVLIVVGRGAGTSGGEAVLGEAVLGFLRQELEPPIHAYMHPTCPGVVRIETASVHRWAASVAQPEGNE